MAKIKPPDDENERKEWIKKQKAKGVLVQKGRTGWVARATPVQKRRRR